MTKRWEQTTDWQKDRQTHRQTDRMTGRQTSGVTERQTGKMAGRHKVGRTETVQTGRRDCNRKMGADDRLRNTDRSIDRQTG